MSNWNSSHLNLQQLADILSYVCSCKFLTSVNPMEVIKIIGMTSFEKLGFGSLILDMISPSKPSLGFGCLDIGIWDYHLSTSVLALVNSI